MRLLLEFLANIESINSYKAYLLENATRASTDTEWKDGTSILN